MSIQHMYTRAYGPTVSGRDRGIPKLLNGADTLIRHAHYVGGEIRGSPFQIHPTTP
jgi:hypothetical protein